MSHFQQTSDKLRIAVQLGVDAKASDWHFQAGQPLSLTINREIVKCLGTDSRPEILVTAEDILWILNTFTPEPLLKRFNCNLQAACDPSARIEGEMFRLHFEMETASSGQSSLALTLRHVPGKIPVMAELGLPIGFQNIIKNPPTNGLIIVSGATGNGKTTTLAAAVNHLNSSFAKKIVTIEAPVEFFHVPLRCHVQHRTVGVDVPSFKEGIEQVLRAGPHVIVVGEMRDLDTIGAAISAAETGHLVFGTLHTNNAPAAMNRILDVVPEGSREQYRTQLAQSLRAIICQRLVPKSGGGLVGAYEFLVNTSAIANQIKENKIGQIRGSISTGMQHQMITLNASLQKLFSEKKITREAALECSDDRKDLEILLGR